MTRAGSSRRKRPEWDDTMPLELPELAAELPHDGPSYAGSLTPSHLTGSGGED